MPPASSARIRLSRCRTLTAELFGAEAAPGIQCAAGVGARLKFMELTHSDAKAPGGDDLPAIPADLRFAGVNSHKAAFFVEVVQSRFPDNDSDFVLRKNDGGVPVEHFDHCLAIPESDSDFRRPRGLQSQFAVVAQAQEGSRRQQ